MTESERTQIRELAEATRIDGYGELSYLAAGVLSLDAELSRALGELDYVYECARRRLKPRWDEMDEGIRSEWIEAVS